MFNIKKHSLMILMAMLMLLIIPMSFAADISEETNTTIESSDISVNEMGIDDVDNVKDPLSIDDSDKLSEGYDFECVPNETEVDYILGTSYPVQLDYTDTPLTYMTLLYAYINDDATPRDIRTPGNFNIYEGSGHGIVDIGSISPYLNVGENTVVFHLLDKDLASENLVNNHYVPIKIIAREPNPPSTIYYVDSSVGVNGDGSEGSIYSTIAAAVEAANYNFADDGGLIVIKKGRNGVYNESSTINISKNMEIRADEGVDVTITFSNSKSLFSQTSKADVTLFGLTFKDIKITSGAIYYQNGNDVDGSTLIVQNCNFVNNEVPTLVRLYKTKATFKQDNFLENTLTDTGNGRGGLITYQETGTSQYQLNKYLFEVSFCNIIGNVFVDKYVFTSPSYQTLVANNNYWGLNYETKPINIYNKESNPEYLTLTNWVNLNMDVPNEVEISKAYSVSLDFKQNSGDALAEDMPDLDVSLSADGDINPSLVTISQNTAAVNYVPLKTGTDTISINRGSTYLNTQKIICGGSNGVYISTPAVNGNNSVEYLVNDHVNVTIAVNCDLLDKFESYDKLYAWIGNTEKQINTMANEASATIDLKMLSDEFGFEEGQTYTIYFHPDIDTLNEIGIEEENCIFNPLDVKIIGTYTPEPIIETTNYTTTPLPSEAAYTIGDSLVIAVNVEYNSTFSDALSEFPIYVYINNVAGIDTGVKANVNNFKFNLKTISNRLAVGVNNITFAIDENDLVNVTTFNKLTVTASEKEYEYTITPNPSVVSYTKGESLNITYTVEHGDLNLNRGTFLVFFDGSFFYKESLDDIDTYAKTFTIDLKDFNDYFKDGENHTIIIRHSFNVLFDDNDLGVLDCKFNILTVNVTGTFVPEIKYETTPNETSIEYIKGSSKLIEITTECDNLDDAFYDCELYAYVDDDEEGICFDGIMADSTPVLIDLKLLDEYLEAGKTYNIVFHPRTSLFGIFRAPSIDNSKFNPLTVTVKESGSVQDVSYTTTPSISSIDYTIGDNSVIGVNIDYYGVYEDDLSELPIYVFINEGQGFEISSIKANSHGFELNLEVISDYLTVGKNTIQFGPIKEDLIKAIPNAVATYNFLTVNAESQDVDTDATYISTPTPNKVYYTLNEHYDVTVTTVYNPVFEKDMEFYSMFVYINGEEIDNRVLIKGIKANETSFTFDLKEISDKLVEGQNNLTFHPHIGALEGTVVGPYIFNNLTVIVGSSPEPINPLEPTVYKDVIYVDTNGNDNNNGSMNSPVLTISKAIELASSIDNRKHKIIIHEGIYLENYLNITSALNIVGEGNVIIDAQGLSNILNINTARTVNISGITFKNGKADKGGAININSGDIIIRASEFINNTASEGASIFSKANSLIIEESTFDSNKADKGAGVYVDYCQNPVYINNNRFTKNVANEGSAIYSTLTTLNIKGNTMSDNEGNGDIYSDGALIETNLTLTFTAPQQANVGESINITAILTDDMGNSISGLNVKFTVNNIEIDSADLVNGIAEIDFTPTEEIEYVIGGSSKYSPIIISTILKPVLNIDIEIDDISGVEGSEITVPVIVKMNGKNVSEDNISVEFNGKTFDVNVVNGVSNVVITLPNKTGHYDLTVSYKGKDQTKVVYSNPKIISVIDINTVIGYSIEGILKDINGNSIGNAELKYTIKGSTASVKTKNDGTFCIENEFDNEITISYGGNNVTLPFSTTVSLKNRVPINQASQFNVSEGQSIETYAVDYPAGERGTNFQFKLTDIYGNPIANATVQFAYKTSIFNRTTDENGIVLLGVSTQFADSYLCALSYLGDEKHNATFVAFNFKLNKKPITITAKAKTFKKSTKTKKYTITLKTSKCASKDGKTYLKSGKKVTLKINGKTYTAKTNKKGQATFKIKLNKKGKYTATIKFAGNKTYKSASKKVKITIK